MKRFDDRQMELAWAAGFVEGEGCFGWYGGTPRASGKPRAFSAVVAVSQNEREPLDRLAEIFGVGIVHPKRNRKRVAWEWRVNGHAAIPVMEELMPLLTTRRQDRILDVLARHYETQRAIAEKAARCPRGHEREGNTGTRANGTAYCKGCSRERAAAGRRAAA